MAATIRLATFSLRLRSLSTRFPISVAARASARSHASGLPGGSCPASASSAQIASKCALACSPGGSSRIARAPWTVASASDIAVFRPPSFSPAAVRAASASPILVRSSWSSAVSLASVTEASFSFACSARSPAIRFSADR
jgi:hypothetical protein